MSEEQVSEERPPWRGRPRPAFEPGAFVLQGRYLLHQVIGRGGMATVYWATDTTLDRPVAVKLLYSEVCSDTEFVRQFLEMERRIARLFHPHVVSIFDAGSGDDGCFVVMEHVPGGSLRDRLTSGTLLPIGDVIKIASQIADALQLLHTEGIVHGDVKPDNVLLDENGDAKLVDFGIAHLATTTGAVEPRSLMGSAPYLAPEQLQEGRATARSDIYALGLVTYELLVGRKPFEGENWVAVATQRLARDPVSLAQVRPDLPAELDRVVMHALARDPRDRFGSADEFRRALQEIRLPTPEDRPTTTAWERFVGFSPAPADGQEAGFDGAGAPAWPTDQLAGTRALAYPAAEARGAASGASRFRSYLRGRRALALAGLAALGLIVGALVLPGLLDPPQPVRTPELVGQTLEIGRGVAREAGIGLKATEEASETAPKGTIIRQEPPTGAMTQSDRPLAVVISSGPPPVRVPDLRQRRIDDARRDLAALGLAIGKIEEREIAQQPWGTVTQQSIRAGSELGRGGTVDVTVGTPPWTTVPKLVDRAVGDAEADLAKRGLHLAGVRLEPIAGKRAGTVIGQDPAGDVRLRQGEGVTVVIVVPPAATTPARP